MFLVFFSGGLGGTNEFERAFSFFFNSNDNYNNRGFTGFPVVLFGCPMSKGSGYNTSVIQFGVDKYNKHSEVDIRGGIYTNIICTAPINCTRARAFLSFYTLLFISFSAFIFMCRK